MTDQIHYANPDETCFVGACFEFRFGAYGSTVVRVIQRPGRLENALEVAAEWLLGHAPGMFVEPDYAAARSERGCDCGYGNEQGCCSECARAAEVDLTSTESGWLPSWEWTVDEIVGEKEGFDEPVFDRFDVVAAYHLFDSLYHGGQWSSSYERLCRARELGSNLPDSFSGLTSNGQAIYRQIVMRDGR